MHDNASWSKSTVILQLMTRKFIETLSSYSLNMFFFVLFVQNFVLLQTEILLKEKNVIIYLNIYFFYVIFSIKSLVM